MAEGTTVGSISYDLNLDDSEFNKGIDKASKKVDSMGDRFKSAEAGSQAFAAGLAAVGAAFVGFGVVSVQAFNDSEKQLAQLDAVLKSTGGAAGVTRDQVIKLASALQQQSTFSDEAIISAENMLLTFTQISKKVFPEATKTVLDMSVALGQDTKTSAIQLGKALNNPIIGVGALRKVGVTFTEDQQKLIEKLVNTGKVLDAQKIILKELNTEFGGSAAAAAKTFSGQIEILKNNFNDFQELVGKAIVEHLRPLVTAFNDWMAAMGGPDGMMKALTTTLQNLIPYIPVIAGFIIGGLTPAFIGLAASIWATMAPLIPFLVIGTALGLIIKAIVDHFGGLQAVLDMLNPVLETLGNIFRDVIKPQLDEVWFMLTEQMIPALQQMWTAIEPILIPVLKFLAEVLGVLLLGAIMTFIGGIKLVIAIITIVAQVVREVAERIYLNFQWLFDTVPIVISDMIDSVVEFFKGLPGRIASGLGGLFNAITKPFRDAFDEIKKIAGEVWEALQKINPFHRNSPSLVDNVMKGVGLIKDQYASLSDITVPALSASLQPSIAQGADSGNQTNMPVNIYIDKVNDQQDVTAIGRELGFRAGLL